MAQFADRFEGVTGSAIRQIFGYLSDPEMISLGGGNPSPDTFPNDQLADIAAGLLREHGSTVLQYGLTRGVLPFIEYLKERNAAIMKDGDDCITLTGSSQGIDLFARSVLNEGDSVIVEGPTFIGALQSLKLCRANLVSVPLEDDGVDIAALEEAIRQYAPKFFYTIPTFQNPTGITTCAEKRQRIYEICRNAGVMILEDDPYGELRYEGDPVPSIKSFDDGTLVTRLCSFSKTVSPGLRVGYAIGPKDVIAHIELLKQGADVHTSNLSQDMVFEYLKSGAYDARLKEICAVYAAHEKAMLDSLDACAPRGMRYTRPEGGLFLWVTLPSDVAAQEVFPVCIEKKVLFVPGTPFFVNGGHENTLRLNFSMPTEDQIRKAVPRLCEAVADVIQKG